MWRNLFRLQQPNAVTMVVSVKVAQRNMICIFKFFIQYKLILDSFNLLESSVDQISRKTLRSHVVVTVIKII